jgi:hypothetical protein
VRKGEKDAKTFLGGLAGLLIVGLLSTPAAALVTDFTWSPADPVMGEMVTYTAQNDGRNPVTSYKWEWKYTSGSRQLDWFDSGCTGPTPTFWETRPGTWDMRLTVTYGGPPGPPPAPTVITKSVTIAPATHFTTVAGLNTSTIYTIAIVLKFQVDAASRPCGGGIQMSCVAQERITNDWWLKPPADIEYPPDTDWGPDTPNERFALDREEILDRQTNGLYPSAWAQISSGIDFSVFTQELRLKYVDPCGDTKYIDLGSHIVFWFKVDPDNWEINEM